MEHMDARPIALNLVLIAIAIPVVGAFLLVEPLLVSVVARQGLVLAAAFEAIRRTCTWVADWYTSFWYVQMANLSRLEGSKQDTAAAAYLVIGTVACVAAGLLSMVLLWSFGEPILRAYTPAYMSASDSLVTIGLTAQAILAVSVLPRISLSLFTGVGLSQAARNVYLVFSTYLGTIIALGLGAFIMIPMFSNSRCEDCIVAANATAYYVSLQTPVPDEARLARERCVAAVPTGQEGFDQAVKVAMGESSAAPVFDPEYWICPSAKSLLEESAAVETIAQFGGAFLLMCCVFSVGYKRGYFAEHGCQIMTYFKDVTERDRREAGAVKNFSRKNFGVFVRSLTGNSVRFITPIIALQMGVTASAVEQFFSSLGSLSYGVPNITSFGIMVIGGRLLGLERLQEFKRHVHLHSGYAFVCAILFGGLAAVTSSLDLPAAFANTVDYDVFEPLAREVYPMAIALQPFRSLYGVYGPILTGCQGFEEWGMLAMAVFVAVYLPIAITAHATGSLAILMASEASVGLILACGLSFNASMGLFLFMPRPCSHYMPDGMLGR